MFLPIRPALIVTFLIAARAQAAPATLVPVTTVEGISEYRLPNGLRVLLFPDGSKPTVTVNVTYFVGSRHEGYGESGMAHLLEHMLFRGTPTHDDVMKLLQERGGNFNGTTWFDRTNYYETMPATGDNLEFGLKLEADRMVNSRISAADLSKEFSVVRNEFEIGENNPAGILEERLLSTAYLWHNYGKSTIGSRSDIEKVPADSLRIFYKKHYQPDNALLVVAGKFETKATLLLIQKYFGALPRPTRTLVPTWTEEPVQDGEREVILRRNGDVAIVSVVYHVAAGADPDWIGTDAVNDILTNKPSGRLYKALVEKGLASEVSGSVYPTAEPGVLVISAKVQPGVAPEAARAGLTKIVEGLGSTPITDVELNRFRARTLKTFELTLTDSGRVGVDLSDWAAMGDWRLFFLTRDRAQTLKTADISRIARAVLKPSNRTVGMFLPTKNPDRAAPLTRPDVAALLKDWKPQQTTSQAEAFAATFDNIDARTKRSTLNSGLQLALLSKKTKGESVRLTLTVRFGSPADVAGKTSAARILGPMLMRGTRAHGFQQLKDEFDMLRAELHFDEPRAGSANANVTTVDVLTKREHLPKVLRLLSEVIKMPAFSPTEFESFRKEMLTNLEEQRQDPMAIGFTTLMQRLLPWPKTDIRYVATVPDLIAQLKATKAIDLARMHQALWGSSAAQLAIVGDLDETEITAIVQKELGSWKSPKPYARIERPFRANEVENDVMATPDKQMSLVALGHSVDLNMDDPHYPAVVMLNQILGGGMNSRLWQRVREAEGLSYGVGSNFMVLPEDRGGVFFAYAMCAPQNAEKALATIEQEMKKLLAEGLSEKELTEAKTGYAAEWENNLADDGFVAHDLAQGLFLGRTMSYWKSLNQKIQALTPADVMAVARSTLKLENLTRVRAGDLGKKP